MKRNSRRHQRRRITAPLALGVALAAMPLTAGAADFTLRTGSANPADFITSGTFGSSTPAFVDLDGDDDFDLAVGTWQNNSVHYYENVGTVDSPSFTELTGTSNPFDGIDVADESVPAFIDQGADGDYDLFLGDKDGGVAYFPNTGTNVSPAFADTPSSGPLDSVTGAFASPAFVDIDGDTDLDFFSGQENGSIQFWRNNSGTYVDESATSHPLWMSPPGGLQRAKPSFVDVDQDGDFDAFVGYGNGSVAFYENTGTAGAPNFIQRTGVDNPLDAAQAEALGFAAPAWVDIDDDGDMDVFIGTGDGYIVYFENTTPITPTSVTNWRLYSR